MHRIYFLDPNVRFDDKLVYTGAMRMETALCPLNAGLPSQHATRQRWTNPIKAIGPIHRMTDIEWTVYHDLLIERDIVEKLQAAQFSGIEFRPAELYTTTETPIGREVFHLKVTGWGGMASPESGIHVIKECPQCKRRVFSGFTDPEKLFTGDAWDGSDFFIIWPMPKFIFVTDRVADWIIKSEYSGVRVKPLEKFQKSLANTYTPGHLHDWFDDAKLAEIMERLGSQSI
jgi:hypothetical protein